jgi:hypothetical protein
VLIHFDQDDVHDVIASVTRFLNPGGVFLFDVSSPWIVRYYLARIAKNVPHTCLPVHIEKLVDFVGRQSDLTVIDKEAIDHRGLLAPLVAAGAVRPRSSRLEQAYLTADRRLSSTGLLTSRWFVAVERGA